MREQPSKIQLVDGLNPPKPSKPLPEQTPEEHKAFCRDCIDFYLARYAAIIADGGFKLQFQQGVTDAEKYLQSLFSRGEQPHEEIDRTILDEIRSEVFKRREQVLVNQTLAFSG
jgi:hypothetical protein